MKILYSPWREAYAMDMRATKQHNASSNDCVFCQQLAQRQDEKNFIIKRFEHSYIMLALYPYNAGHMLILPYAHQANLFDIHQDTRNEMMDIVAQATRVCNETLKADGCNVGINLGKAAGAGIPAHLHVHVVPRWAGDTNFMPVIGEVKQISFDLQKIYEKLKGAF